MENNFNITSASVSDRGLSEKRPENEDSFLILEERGVYAVADGVGGAQAGDVASQMAMEILGEAFIHLTADLDAEDVMRAAIDRANSSIHQMATDLPQLASMATTIVALHVYGNIATIGHVGDSRVYRLDHAGVLRRETDDHSVVEEEVRAGRMTPEQAINHPSKNVISRALGAEGDVEIELKTIMVEPGTTFLLCSDGVTRHIGDGELGEILSDGSDLAEQCSRIKEICYERGAEDNLTAVVVRVSGKPAEEFSAAAGLRGESEEEATLAGVRSPFDSKVAGDSEQVQENGAELSNSRTVEAEELDDQPYLMEDAEEESLVDERKPDLQDYSSSSVIVPARQPELATETRAYSDDVVEETTPGLASKLLSAVVFLLIGGILGAAGYYAWVQSQPVPEPIVQTPALSDMKSTNISLTAFEDGRREVDRDPVKYLNANPASMQTAEDYFLMGRASMLTGKYWEAKRAFNEARSRLASADPKNAKTLAMEISMALAIIESPQATESFTRDVTTAANSAMPANSNTNSNASSNSNTNSNLSSPVR